MKMPVNLLKALLYLIAAVVLLMGPTACKPQETELSFETIELESYPGSIKQWEGKEPKLLIVADVQNIDEVRHFVTDKAALALSQADFTAHFAILAFRGLQGSSHGGFKIERIIRRGNEVILYAQPGIPGPELTESSPYHLILVQKQSQMKGDFTFSLYFSENQAAVASTARNIP